MRWVPASEYQFWRGRDIRASSPSHLKEPYCKDTRSDHMVFSQVEAPEALVLSEDLVGSEHGLSWLGPSDTQSCQSYLLSLSKVCRARSHQPDMASPAPGNSYVAWGWG